MCYMIQSAELHMKPESALHEWKIDLRTDLIQSTLI